MTVVELLVCISIVAILFALLLPAVQFAREQSRRIACSNNLRQIGIGLTCHHDAIGYFPSDGWGWRWVGDPARGNGVAQPGGWSFSILPFVEAKTVYDGANGTTPAEQRANRSRMLSHSVQLLYCPSRRRAATYPYTLSATSLVNADPPPMAAKTDYAICAGDVIHNTAGGPPSELPGDIAAYAWPSLDLVSGVGYVRTEVRAADMTDGLSHCLLVGEKCLGTAFYTNGLSIGDDQSAYIGDDADIRRWTAQPPVPDRAYDNTQLFGGPHPGGCQCVLADGSVALISFDVDERVFRAIGNRHDGFGYER